MTLPRVTARFHWVMTSLPRVTARPLRVTTILPRVFNKTVLGKPRILPCVTARLPHTTARLPLVMMRLYRLNGREVGCSCL